MVPIEHEYDDSKHQPAQVDEGRVGDVLEHELGENCADRNRPDHRQNRDAVAAELDIARHPVRPVEVGLHEPKAHHRKVRRAERESRGQRVDSAHQVDLFRADEDSR